MCILLCMAAEMTNRRIPQWTVGDRLRKARETAGIFVEEMATKVGRSRNSVTKYERARTVDVNIVRSYADLTDTPMEWLLTGHGPDEGGPFPDGVTLRQRRGIRRGNPLILLPFAA